MLTILCALLVAVGCIALAQACAQANLETTATLSVAVDPAHISGPANLALDDRGASDSGTDVLQSLGACMIALSGVVALIAAHRAPAPVGLRPLLRLTRALPGPTARAVRHAAAPPHALCVIRV